MKRNLSRRVLSVLLALMLVLGMVAPIFADEANSKNLKYEIVNGSEVSKLSEALNSAEDEDAQYDDNDMVRVSIVLEEKSTVEKFNTTEIAHNAAALSYRKDLAVKQDFVAKEISAQALDNEELDVVWNLTLAANIISANVRYGQIDEIKNVAGVSDVVIENRYEPMVVDKNEAADPNMATSSEQIGSGIAWAAGYTGAGSKVAVIDTGIDLDHISFNGAAFEYSLAYQAERHGMTPDEYKESLNLLDEAKIAEVLGDLNISKKGITAADLYRSSKIPFAFNYVDKDLDVTHLNDTAGEHGSHVEGIAAANAYVLNGDGTFSPALQKVFVQGVAPDAQIVTMKVFGKGGGAYDSDYMVAIEDAVMLGCDSVNLSLGSAAPGYSRTVTAAYADIMAMLTSKGTVVCMSAGNSGSWADSASTGGYLYSDDVGLHAGGSPGSYTNSLGVASVDNSGSTSAYFAVAGNIVGYSDTHAQYSNEAFTTLAGEREYVLIDGTGTDTDWAALGDAVKGKIALCSRGTISLYQKAQYAVEAGAIGTIIYNNQPGVVNMDLSDYKYSQPAVSITQADGNTIRANSTPVYGEDGNVLYYTGTMTVSADIEPIQGNSDTYTMSSFSAWGVPGSLQLKPEITAPGGSIYSVWGANKSSDSAQTEHDQYEVMSGTSMASPQVAGMAAVLGQYIRDTHLTEKTGRTQRQLINSLLMSTAKEVFEDGAYVYSVLKQGAGLANVGAAIAADAYIMVDDNLSGTASDGKVKFELGDDPTFEGRYQLGFTINNFTDTTNFYDVSSYFFTQDLFMNYVDNEGNTALFLDTRTTPISVNATYTVDGVEYVPEERPECDLDHDGDTDENDADIILEYAAGNIETIDEIADLNGDGVINTYDAYLLLCGAGIPAVEVPANGSVHVVIDVELTEETKEYFDWLIDAEYIKGAYIEGYVTVKSVSDEEGVKSSDHSIPVLGFYGNWSEPSMYDRNDIVSYNYYNNNTIPYTGALANYLKIKYPGESSDYDFTGNPYMIENAYPTDRLALSSGTTITKYGISQIRNAGARAVFAQNENGEVVYIGALTEQAYGAYYYTNDGSWQNTTQTINFNKTVSALGVKENEKVTIGVVAVPEYYENGGRIDEAQLKALIENGVLGEGAYLKQTYTVDNTAPKLVKVSKNLMNGALTIAVEDNQYVAFMGLYKGKSTSQSKYIGGGVPYQDAAGEPCGMLFNLDKTAGEYVTLVVADYAGNETVVQIEYGGEPEDFTDRMFGFTSSSVRGSGYRWVEIESENLYYTSDSDNGGMSDVAAIDLDVYAAEYVGKYVFFATDSAFYVSEMENMEEYQKVADFPADVTGVNDMAFNYKDRTMYVLDDANTVYTLDLISGEMADVATITVTNPKSTSATYKKLAAMAIDDDGNFYAVNIGSSSYTFLYKWTLADVVDGEITALDPVNNTSTGNVKNSLWLSGLSSLAWDHTNAKLYLASNYGAKNNNDTDNALWVIDTETGKAAAPTETLNGKLRAHVVGLFVVPSLSYSLPKTAPVTSVVLDIEEASVIKGTVINANADVYPWLAADKTVTWTSSDEAVAVVDANGTVTAVGVGTAVITAASNADKTISDSMEITVAPVPSIDLTGIIYDADSNVTISDFNTQAPAEFVSAASYNTGFAAGALYGDKIYTQDGSNMYAIDADTLEVSSLGGIASSWCYSDAAPMLPSLVEEFGGYTVVGPCNNGTYLEVLNPEAGSLTYWNGWVSIYQDDPMAVIALAGETVYSGYTAGVYYVMTESGELWLFLLYNGGYCARQDLGATGLELGNVSANGEDKASMYYDAVSGQLVVASYKSGEDTAQLYLVDPASLTCANVGDFGEKVWPAVSLYQYERATDLKIKMDNIGTLEMFEGDVKTINARVILGETNELTWTTSDAAVVTVDNGVVTAVAAGTAEITLTTVDTNAAGEHLSAVIPVVVKEKVSVKAEIHVLLEGTTGATVDLRDLSTTADGYSTAATFDAGGMVGGALYGVYGGSSIVNSEIYGYDVSDSNYIALDVANFPAFTSETSTFTNCLLYPSTTNYLVKFDYDAGKISTWNLSSAGMNLCAITYAGSLSDDDGVNHVYYALGTDGTLYMLYVYEGSTANSLQLSRGARGNIGVTFADQTAVSMSYVWDGTKDGIEGLVILDANTMSMYWVADPSTSEAPTAGAFGTLEGTFASTLYNPMWDGITSISNATSAIAERFADKAELGAVEAETVALAPVGAATLGNNEYSAEKTEDVAEEASADAAFAHVSMSQSLYAANVFAGSLNGMTAVNVTRTTGNAAPASVVVDTDTATANEVTMTLTEDMAVTNGVIKVSYNPAELTYVGTTSTLAHKAVKVDETAGVITFAYASAEAINSALATIKFSYENNIVITTVTMTTTERNEEAEVVEDPTVIELREDNGEHNYVVIDSLEPTCTEDGYVTYKCEHCYDTYTDTLTALGHTPADAVVENNVDPTCTTDGSYDVVVYCTVCGAELSRDTITVAALGHTHGDAVRENNVDPTCTTDGSYDEVVYCTVCGAEISRETKVVNKLGHKEKTLSAKEPTCTETGLTEGKMCTVCGEILVAQNVIPALGHVKRVVNESAVYTGDVVCKRCGEVLEEGEYRPLLPFPLIPSQSGEDVPTTLPDDKPIDEEPVVDVPAKDELPFTDVAKDAPYYEAVAYLYKTGIMNGTGDTTFSPDYTLNRATVVTMLYRLEGCPEVEADTTFTDVEAGEWYTAAVQWAASVGIVNGYGDGTFGPKNNVTNEQLAAIIRRYAEYKGVTIYETTELPEGAVVSDWAVGNVAWAASEGILSAEQTADAKTYADRAQVAVSVYTYIIKTSK